MTADGSGDDPRAAADVCVACAATELRIVETISAAVIADGWRREDIATGALDVVDQRTHAILSALPKEIRFVGCRRCGLEMARPLRVWSTSEYPADQSYPVRWEFLQCVKDLAGGRLDVLELGCGTGEFLAMASAGGHRAVGLDFSPGAVGLARRRGLTAFEGALEDLGRHVGADTRFDAVVLFQVIEHLCDPHALFATIAEWVRPHARLFISCPAPRRYTRLIAEQLSGRSDFWDYPPHHVIRWTLPGLRAIASRHGWRTVRAVEEPLSWAGAASRIGVARAMYRGQLHQPAARRLTIAAAWMRLLMAGSDRRTGESLYLYATRDS